MDLSQVISVPGVRVLHAGVVGNVPGGVTGGSLAGGVWAAGIRVCDITEDSRTVVPGSLFIARAGLKADGNRYIADAIQGGAAAILTDNAATAAAGIPILFAEDIPLAAATIAEQFWGLPSRKLKVILVTGTNGKTTTTYLIWRMLNEAGIRCGLMGTVIVDDGRGVAPAEMTTPPSIEISRSLSSMVEAGCGAVVMEASSHALDQKRLDALTPDIAIFTNLTGDHLDYHKTMEAYAGAKARLFEMLNGGGESRPGLAIVNAEDSWATRMTRDTKAPILECRLGGAGAGGAGVGARIEILSHSMDGMGLRIGGPWGTIETQVPLIGRYNAMNILQAVAACHAMGVSGATIGEALSGVEAPPGRLERVTPAPPQSSPFAVFVDYAHSDDALANMLSAVADAMPGRRHRASGVKMAAGGTASNTDSGSLWVVFGCGGDRDRSKRPRMGRVAAELADRLVITSDNPRSERPSEIVDEIIAGIPAEARARMTVQIDRARAIRFAVEGARPGDVVVIAGKGHETEQILSDGRGGLLKTHFDDREVARGVLRELAPTSKSRSTGVLRA